MLTESLHPLLLCRVTSVLQFGSMVAFSMAWVTVLDYFTFMFDCRWTDWQTGPHHIFFPEQSEWGCWFRVQHVGSAGADDLDMDWLLR